jgi:hypothetical protein
LIIKVMTIAASNNRRQASRLALLDLNKGSRELAAYGAPFVDAAGLIAAVRGIEGEVDPTRLMRLTVPA